MYTEVTIKAKLTEDSEQQIGIQLVSYEDMNENIEFRGDFIEGMEEALLSVIQKYNEVYVIGDDEVPIGDDQIET